MALGQFRKVYGKNGSGRFVVSEGIAPSAYLLPHEALPTLYHDLEDDRFEIVIPMGTILTLVEDDNGDSRIVPATGGAAVTWNADDDANEDGATPGTGTTGDTVVIDADKVPIGCAQYDLYRPFDKGTSQGAGWIARGYVEWPVIDELNEDLEVGGLVKSDNIGRPVAAAAGDGVQIVGKVIEKELFVSNFDSGLLSYMQLPSDPGALKAVYEITKPGPYQGKMGIRGNLDVTNVVGAVRVNLNL